MRDSSPHYAARVGPSVPISSDSVLRELLYVRPASPGRVRGGSATCVKLSDESHVAAMQFS